jgi:hypothetical protein
MTGRRRRLLCCPLGDHAWRLVCKDDQVEDTDDSYDAGRQWLLNDDALVTLGSNCKYILSESSSNS